MPVKQTASEKLQKAAAHRKQGLALELAARAEKIYSIIKGSAELCGACEAALEDCGVDLESHFKNDAAPKSKAAAKSKERVDASSFLPRTTTALGGLHQDVLMYLLVNIGEAVVTPHALNALKPTAKKAIPKAAIQELIEFATECSPSSWIGTSGPLKVVGNLQKALAKLNELHGHRLRCLPLPPQWDTHGVYQISSEGDSIFVTHKFLTDKPTRALPADQLAVINDMTNLHIEANHSSKGAILVESDAVLSYPLKKLFKDDFPDDPFEDIKAFVVSLPSDGAAGNPQQAMLTAPRSECQESENPQSVKQPFNIKRMGSQSWCQSSQKRRGGINPGGDSPPSKEQSDDDKPSPADAKKQDDNSCRKDLNAVLEAAGGPSPKKTTELDMDLPDAEP